MSWRPRLPRVRVPPANDKLPLIDRDPFGCPLRAQGSLPGDVTGSSRALGERMARARMPPISVRPHYRLRRRSPAVEFGWRTVRKFANKERSVSNLREDADAPCDNARQP